MNKEMDIKCPHCLKSLDIIYSRMKCFTKNQKKIAELSTRGVDFKTIASVMGTSIHSVNVQLQSCYNKTGLTGFRQNRYLLTLYLLGLISIDDIYNYKDTYSDESNERIGRLLKLASKF
jgi:DNA-binding CsgD family transcriptional regulator